MIDPPVPPVPQLATVTNGTSAPLVANDWRRVIESVPISAETVPFTESSFVLRAIKVTPDKTVISMLRSPFRTGQLLFDADGMVLEGKVTKPLPRWLSFVSGLGAFVGFFCIYGVSLARQSGIPRSTRLIIVMVSLMISIGPAPVQAYFNRKRQQAKFFLSWHSLQEIYVDPAMKYVALVYTSPAVAKVREMPREFLALANIDPNVVQGIVSTIQHYAPHVIKKDGPRSNGINIWRILSGVFFGFCLIVILVLGLAIFIRRNRP